MYFDLQKASFWKRLSAFVFDAILLSVLATLFLFLLSSVTGYDRWTEKMNAGYQKIEDAYGIDFDITEGTYNSFTPEEKTRWDDAYSALTADEETMKAYNKVVDLSLIVLSLGIFLAYLVLEFTVPLLLGDGRTLGKKIFGISLMRTNHVRVGHISLFIRTVIGKYAIETMIPAYLLYMIYFNTLGLEGILVIGALILLQGLLYFITKNNSLIHDLLADTVVVDYLSQKIFKDEEERQEYLKAEAAEKAARASY